MTRARDSLILYGKQGVGKDKTPPGFPRELLKDSSLKHALTQRAAREFQPALFATRPLHRRLSPAPRSGCRFPRRFR